MRVRQGPVHPRHRAVYPALLLRFQELVHGPHHTGGTTQTTQLTVVLLIFEALSYISNYYLATCIDNLMKSFSSSTSIQEFSETLAGVTFLAFANGAPDVLTAIIAGNSSSQETAMIPFGSLFGATIFSCGIILARVIKFSPNSHENGLKVNRG